MHGISTPLPMVYRPPTHGISTHLPMLYRPPYPWYVDPLLMLYRALYSCVSNMNIMMQHVIDKLNVNEHEHIYASNRQ